MSFFNIHAVAKKIKNFVGGLSKILEKINSAEKSKKGDPLIWFGLVCYAKKGKFITVQFPGPNGTNWLLKFCRTFRGTILVSSRGLRKKRNYYSRGSLHEMRTKMELLTFFQT